MPPGDFALEPFAFALDALKVAPQSFRLSPRWGLVVSAVSACRRTSYFCHIVATVQSKNMDPLPRPDNQLPANNKNSLFLSPTNPTIPVRPGGAKQLRKLVTHSRPKRPVSSQTEPIPKKTLDFPDALSFYAPRAEKFLDTIFDA